MLMDGVSFYFVEDGQLKFDTVIVQETDTKQMINVPDIFKDKKLKHIDFGGFEFDIKFTFEVNRIDDTIILTQKKDDKKEEKTITTYKLKNEGKFNDRLFMTIIAFSGKNTSLTLNLNKVQVYELNTATDINITYKDKELTDATVNDVLMSYSRHKDKDSVLNVLIEQDSIKNNAKVIGEK